MKALLLAATSSLALTGFAVAQTATDSATTTDTATTTAPAATGADSPDGGPAGTATGTATGTDGGSGMATGTDAGGTSSGGGMTTGTDAAGTTTTGAAGTTTDSGSGTGAGTATGTTGSGMGATGAGSSAGGTDAATTSTDTGTTTGAAATGGTMTTTTATDAGAAATMSADHPGMLGSWIMKRRIWTTNQPSSTAWQTATLTDRPAEWTDIAKVDDIVVDAEGNITGYVADIGGFLGLGAKQVLLNPDALHFVQIGDDAFFATNFTREELEALPDFDTTTVMR